MLEAHSWTLCRKTIKSPGSPRGNYISNSYKVTYVKEICLNCVVCINYSRIFPKHIVYYRDLILQVLYTFKLRYVVRFNYCISLFKWIFTHSFTFQKHRSRDLSKCHVLKTRIHGVWLSISIHYTYTFIKIINTHLDHRC